MANTQAGGCEPPGNQPREPKPSHAARSAAETLDEHSMMRFTIDTNCINARQRDKALNELEKRARAGELELTATVVMLDELDRDRTTLAQARRDKASRMPIARSGFMVGHSAVGGYDVIGGPDAYRYIDAIAAIVCPGELWDALGDNTQRDIMHLSAHLTYGWDVFVSRDRGVLAAAGALLQHLGLRVMTPEDALVLVVQTKQSPGAPHGACG